MAVNLKDKKTTLDESASIYVKRDENMSEKERWSEMSKKERKTHFKEYYLRTLILSLIAITAFGYMIYNAVTSYRNQELFVAIVNDSMRPETKEAFTEELMELLGLDPKKDKITIDSDFVLSGTDADTNVLQRLTALLYSETLDVIIADPDTFRQYLINGTISNLSELLPSDMLIKHEEYLYFPEEGGELDADQPFGLRLTGSQTYQNLGMHQPDPIVGVVANSNKKENAVQFLTFLFPY